MNKYWSILFLACILSLPIFPLVYADPSSPETITVTQSNRRTLGGGNSSLFALAGNITEINMEGQVMITQGWQGYYGNISGTIVLDDSNNNTLYSWTLGQSGGEIFAVRNHSIDWSSGNIVCANEGNVSIENSLIFPGADTGDNDNITNTFNSTTHPAFDVADNSFSANECSHSVSLFVDDSADSGRQFNETLLYSVSHETIIYMSYVVSDKNGFRSGSTDLMDFELIVGEDGHSDSSTTRYYFYVELG